VERLIPLLPSFEKAESHSVWHAHENSPSVFTNPSPSQISSCSLQGSKLTAERPRRVTGLRDALPRGSGTLAYRLVSHLVLPLVSGLGAIGKATLELAFGKSGLEYVR
jgi:hypothetical protein